jgi:hypothetical protein
MDVVNRKVAGTRRRLDRKPPRPTLAVVIRHQTSEERHRYQTSLDVLLREMIRQQMGRRR